MWGSEKGNFSPLGEKPWKIFWKKKELEVRLIGGGGPKGGFFPGRGEEGIRESGGEVLLIRGGKGFYSSRRKNGLRKMRRELSEFGGRERGAPQLPLPYKKNLPL